LLLLLLLLRTMGMISQLEHYVESRLIVWPAAWAVPLAEDGRLEADEERTVLYRLRFVALLPATLSVLWIALLVTAGFVPTRFGSLISALACTVLCVGLSTQRANQTYTMVTKAVFLGTILLVASLSQLPLATVSYTSSCPPSPQMHPLSARCTARACDNVLMSANCFIFGFCFIIFRRLEAGLLLLQMLPRDGRFVLTDRTAKAKASAPAKKTQHALRAEVAEVLSGDESEDEQVLIEGVEIRMSR
jgi:hypothetical protein